MKETILILVITLAASVSATAQNKSVYTSTSDKVCKKVEPAANEGGDYIGICPGVGGYKLRLIEGDLRQTLFVITPKKKELPLNLTSFYSAFSAVGQQVEWRLKKGIPVALIARYNVANGSDSSKRISYLMIAKIGKQASCVTDIVSPSMDQNEAARKLADSAPSKPCKSAE